MSSEPLPEPVPYGRQSLEDDDIAAVVAALRAPFITQGSRVEEFERGLCAATGAAHAVAVSSGTAALHTAYAAAGLGAGDEVVTSPLSFVATASAAVHLGARPVFADIRAADRCLDPAAVAARLGARSRAIVAVDFAGHPAAYDELRALATDRGLTLIADACHSLGGIYRGRRVGTLADLTCLSFHPVKAITTGEGGAVLTDDPDLARRCREFRTHGQVRDPARMVGEALPWAYEIATPGLNYRLTDFQSALGLSQLGKLEGFLARRRRLAERYRELLGNLEGVTLPAEAPEARSAWHLYAVEVPAAIRRPVFERLRQARIGVQVHYVPIYRQPYYRSSQDLKPGDFPHTEAYYSRAITLPLFPALAAADQDRVGVALREAIAAEGGTGSAVAGVASGAGAVVGPGRSGIRR